MSRRKNYSDDSSDDDDGFARKRRRHSDNVDIEERLESLISRVGDKTTSSSLENNLEGLASVLEADLSNYKTKILKILCNCVKNMPQRMTVYTTLVGLLNAKNYNAGGDFIEMLVRSLKEALKAGSYLIAQQVIRFMSDLVNCHVVMVSSLLTLYNTFLEVSLEDNIPQVRSDWYIYAILSCLPWVGQELSQKKGSDFDRLLASIENYLKKRQKIHVPALRVWSNDDGFLAQEDYLESLWAQVQALRNNRWEENQIIRPYAYFDGVLCDALQHTIPTIMLPSHDEDISYPLPRVLFRMFDYADIPEGVPPLPAPHSIERLIMEEHLNATIHSHYVERKECAEALVTATVKFKVPLNYMIVETVFGQLFQLPSPPHLELFYGSLLIELCKLQPSSMPQVLAQATEILYDRLDCMNTSCIQRFSNWFAYHLSNFQFKWSWEDWSDCLVCDEEMPKPKFVRETLRKSLRLSYHQRVTDIVPSNFAKLLPPKPVPFYKYEKDGAGSLPGTMVAHRLMQAIKSKCGPDEAKEILRELPKPIDDEDANSPLKTDVCVQTLLFLAAKSLSHSFAAIAKFHPLLKSLGQGNSKIESEEFQVCILKSLYELWKAQPQMMVVIIDKLLKTQIIECSAVASWIFSPEMTSELTSFYVWEILHSTIVKMIKQVSKLKKEIEEMRDKYDEHERKKKNGYDDDDEYRQDVPTEAAIEREEDKLKELQSSQKNLFLIIFQRFIMILTEHLAQCETQELDYNTPLYKAMIDRLQEMFLQYHEQVYKYVSTLESLLFTSDIDLHILEVFQQFCALRS